MYQQHSHHVPAVHMVGITCQHVAIKLPCLIEVSGTVQTEGVEVSRFGCIQRCWRSRWSPTFRFLPRLLLVAHSIVLKRAPWIPCDRMKLDRLATKWSYLAKQCRAPSPKHNDALIYASFFLPVKFVSHLYTLGKIVVDEATSPCAPIAIRHLENVFVRFAFRQ